MTKKTKTEVIKLFNTIATLAETKMNSKAAYGLIKNKKLLEKEIEIVKELQTKFSPSPEFLEYNKKRLDILEENSKKDENQKPLMREDHLGRSFDLEDDKEEFVKEKIEELREEYKETIEEQEKIENDFNSLMEEEVSFDFFQILVSNLPDLNMRTMEIIECMISE